MIWSLYRGCHPITTRRSAFNLTLSPWLIGLLMTACLGCSGDPFAVPPPDLETTENRDATVPRDPTAVNPESRNVALILDKHDPDELELFTMAARKQAGLDHVRLLISSLAPTDFSSHQADLVRSALEQKPMAIIIEPADSSDPRLAEAVVEASQSTPIYVLYRPLTGFSAQRPAPGRISVVVPPDFNVACGRLVQIAMRNAKTAGIDPKAGAVLLIKKFSDAFLDDRIDALKKALQNAGVQSITEVYFSQKIEQGMDLLVQKLKADHKPTLVFGLDEFATNAVHSSSSRVIEERPFVKAGFSYDNHLAGAVGTGDIAAVAEFATWQLARKAISAASKQPKTMPETIVYECPVHESPAEAGLPKVQTFYNSMKGGSTADK